MTKRLFIAADIIEGEKLIDLFVKLKEVLSEDGIRWVNSNNLHLTLKFLGETEELLIPSINEKLYDVTADFNPFIFQLKGLGYFGSKNDPRILFIKIENGEVLKRISICINEKLKETGIEKEEKDFNAHLTLGRIKSLKNRKKFYTEIEKYSNNFIQEVEINKIILYESFLTREGPIYKVVQKFPLKGK